MFKKFFVCCSAFFLFSPLNVAHSAAFQIYWPGYIDNSECLRGNECGKTALSIFPSGKGTFFNEKPSMIFGGIARHTLSGNLSNPKDYVQRMIVSIKLNLTSYHSYDPTLGDFGLMGGNGTGETGYRMKGWALTDKIVTLQIRKCNTDANASCHLQPVDKVIYLEYSLDDIINRKPIDIELSRGENIGWVAAWMKNNNFRLSARKYNGSDQYVRSIRLPGISMTAGLTRYNPNGGTIGTYFENFDKLMQFQDVQLNHRRCHLNIGSNGEVNFGSITVKSNQIGRISKEMPSNISLTCNNFTESFVKGGHIDNGGGANENKTVLGTGKLSPEGLAYEGVHHSVESIQIRPATVVNINNNQQIGFVDGPSNIYVEGSLSENNECGVNALPVNQIIKNGHGVPKEFYAKKDYGDPKDPTSIKDQYFDTIYWKICKSDNQPVKGGDYSGTATIEMVYK